MKYYSIIGHPGYIMDEDGKIFGCDISKGRKAASVPVNRSEHVRLNGKQEHYPNLKRGREIGATTSSPDETPWFRNGVICDGATTRLYEDGELVSARPVDPPKEVKEKAEPAPADAEATNGEEGKFTDAESIRGAHSFAAVEGIAESMGVDISGIELMRDQKKALLKALK